MPVQSHRASRAIASAVAVLFAAGVASADVHTTGVPVLNSDPGAAYTLYLDVAGFNYTGTWSSNEQAQPGSTPALNLNGEATNIAAFTPTDQTNIKTIWAQVAQQYSVFNVNVTTVDPAVAAGQSATDQARQTYYDVTPNLMHMVFGSQIRAGNTDWYSYAADGVSGLGVISKVSGDTGSGGGGDSPPDVSHTNWMFTASVSAPGVATGEILGPNDAGYAGAIGAHENGHALGLYHQSDYVGTTLKNEYSLGDASSGVGSYVPTMGNSLTLGNTPGQRTTFRSGPSDNGTTNQQNDVATVLAGNAGLGLFADGIGHSLATATPLPLAGSGVDPAAAKGVIVPASAADAQPTAVGDSTQDYFSFLSDGLSPITLTANDGTEYLTPGVADTVGSLQSTLTILNALGVAVGTATEDPTTLFETYTGTLPAGTYYADVASIGGHAQVDPAGSGFTPSTDYNIGAFFLTGSGFATTAVPEPTAIALLALGGLGLVGRRRRAAR